MQLILKVYGKILLMSQIHIPMTDDKNAPIMLSQDIQKAYIAVDESGTTAAAATAATATLQVGSVETYHRPLILNIDHPFIFIIFDMNTQLILFMGNVWNPSQN